MSWQNYDTWYYGLGRDELAEELVRRGLVDRAEFCPLPDATEQANCPECGVPMTQLFHHQNCKTWLERGHD